MHPRPLPHFITSPFIWAINHPILSFLVIVISLPFLIILFWLISEIRRKYNNIQIYGVPDPAPGTPRLRKKSNSTGGDLLFNLALGATDVYLSSTDEEKAKVKRIARNLTMPFWPTQKLIDAKTNLEHYNALKLTGEATAKGITPLDHAELQKERVRGEIRLDEKRAETRHVISASLQVNAEKLRRKREILAEIRQLESQLKEPECSEREKQLLKKDLETLEAEYEQLGQNTV